MRVVWSAELDVRGCCSFRSPRVEWRRSAVVRNVQLLGQSWGIRMRVRRDRYALISALEVVLGMHAW